MDKHYIAGWNTADNWSDFRLQLEKENTEDIWSKAFKDYFITRLELRYLDPIKILQENSTYLGEGFSIMAILCSLIEFIESTYQGKIYRYVRNAEELEEHEYCSSKSMFLSFLLNRPPFDSIFNEAKAKDFYSNIRCGLLHEASTKNGWRIWAKNEEDEIIDFNKKIIYRDNFHSAIRAHIAAYGEELKVNENLKSAFIRKFDSL